MDLLFCTCGKHKKIESEVVGLANKHYKHQCVPSDAGLMPQDTHTRTFLAGVAAIPLEFLTCMSMEAYMTTSVASVRVLHINARLRSSLIVTAKLIRGERLLKAIASATTETADHSSPRVNRIGMKLKGSCHCGAVKFEVESKTPQPFMHCYCTICRKTQGGGGYTINIMVFNLTNKVTGVPVIPVLKRTSGSHAVLCAAAHCLWHETSSA